MILWETVLNAHLELAKKIQADKAFAKELEKTADDIFEAVMHGGKVLLFGNGGSAADAQHIAAEFVGKFRFNREAMNAIALTTNTSVLTAVSNDFDFSGIFSRQVSALITEKDVAIGISTSGFSKNVISGLCEAKKAGAYTILLAGQNYENNIADTVIAIPSEDTPRIQEIHILIGHYWAEYVEKKLIEVQNIQNQATEEK